MLGKALTTPRWPTFCLEMNTIYLTGSEYSMVVRRHIMPPLINQSPVLELPVDRSRLDGSCTWEMLNVLLERSVNIKQFTIKMATRLECQNSPPLHTSQHTSLLGHSEKWTHTLYCWVQEITFEITSHVPMCWESKSGQHHPSRLPSRLRSSMMAFTKLSVSLYDELPDTWLSWASYLNRRRWWWWWFSY